MLGDKDVAGLVVTMRDVTVKRELARELEQRVFRDDLTKLANRSLFMDRLDQARLRSRRTGSAIAVMFVDLDDFKAVNDGLGHAAGDTLLCAVSGRLSECLRPSDTIARLGGDEFAVLLDGVADVAEVMNVAQRLLEVLQLPVEIDELSVTVPASIGIAIAEQGHAHTQPDARRRHRAVPREGAGQEPHRGVRHVDGLGGVLAPAPAHPARIGDRERRAARALPTDHLARFQRDRRRRGARALGAPQARHALAVGVRPDRRGERAHHRHRSLGAAGGVRARGATGTPGDRNLYVSVNVSARQLREAGFAAEIAAALESSGLEPAKLMLELTESVLIDEVAGQNLVDNVAPLGVGIAIDDFGTGYSSLAYLQRFPVNVVKIDRSFVSRLNEDGMRAVVKSMAAISR